MLSSVSHVKVLQEVECSLNLLLSVCHSLSNRLNVELNSNNKKIIQALGDVVQQILSTVISSK
jgi:hypothetical protein